MQQVYDLIEQLDLAGKQLQRIDHPGYARFSLILTDNIVELMLYQRCKFLISRDDGMFIYGRQYDFRSEKTYNPRQRDEALGQRFDKRLDFCQRIGTISEAERKFISTVHKYRSDVYHGGILHDDLLYPLAYEHHEFTCDLFQRLCPEHHAWSSNDKLSEVVLLHTQQAGIRIGCVEDDIANAAESLKRLKPRTSSEFAERLGQLTLRRIDDFDEALYLLSDQGRANEDTILRDIQFHFYLTGKNSPFWDDLQKVRSRQEFEEVQAVAQQSWRPRFRKTPTEKWRRRALALQREKCRMVALDKFEAILRDMKDIDSMIQEAATEYDYAMERKLDELRGK